MLHDPSQYLNGLVHIYLTPPFVEEYSEPFVFNPDRFIDSKSHKAELDPAAAVFGFGRRICPGKF